MTDPDTPQARRPAAGKAAGKDDAAASVTDLRVTVGDRRIVDGVNLRLVPGRITALVGPSGSGKTTTGLALLGEHPAGASVTGTVDVPGGSVGYVPQHPATVLNPARRCGALLHDIARRQVRHLPRGERAAACRERVLDALARAQLADGADLVRRYPHELSGGQQQRLVIAQALLFGARVVVADEPTTGQDALTKRRVVGELAAVARQGIALLLLSHDMSVVHELADEVVVLRNGRVVATGSPDRVLPEPAAPPAPPAGPAVVAGAEVLRVSGLTARHRSTEVLHDARLSVRAGEFVAVVGRSGSGKTTLARCVAGLHRWYDGQVSLDGAVLPRSVRGRTRDQLAAVQYVFQDAQASFDEHRPVVDQVARTARRLRGVNTADALAEARATLTGLGLPAETAAQRPGRLSGGELQRAALARAMIARPRVLICDEVTSGLDPATRRAILDLLADTLGEHAGLAVVLITHDLRAAARTHRTVVLDQGRIVEQGPTTRLLTSPSHPFTASLLQLPSH
ncbi:ABC transporter ATP-binding protein [Streptomyces sp. 8K308]|uniref:ABC transporter ATP-binding protein n=1 Tax=Streptomyces sp. 8K308 TaxID=2530388 RepID=UPI001048E69A|nr:ATP-binding cassette domain-containing protein [Streptomyces sp. 8K308]TDC11082.1 ABC transporter ATP-binding protein [Streptomyces sp. 8K308]